MPAGERGTYLAFTHDDTDGMRHLRRLADAGLNTVHLLPAFDIATIEERRSAQQVPACDLAAMAPDSAEQQECVDAVRGKDGFNWGYDPLHYTAPEGSYATDPEGTRRTVEFRRMVQGLNGAGLQVVMDVVYNHTAASGQAATSVLDRVVPGYYQRLDAKGAVESSTCCSNTATEHRMMEKLMIDSVLTWARDYKVNGFRFDLMGHHSLENMQRLRAALDRLTVRRDGVDGRSIYLYGEGWNFGEVADDALFVQATQRNLAGTGIGSFSDRLRDAVRGGGPFDEDPRVQGFGSGLFTDPNGAEVNGTPAEQRADLLHLQDLVKLGLAGNLRDFSFRTSTGETVLGKDVDYNGQPAGYAADPGETVTYVDAHDNETLFDSLALKLPQGTSMADRVRMNTALAVHGGALPGRGVLARRHRPAPLQEPGPQLLRLGRLVQPGRLVPAGEHLRLGAAAGGRQRRQVGLHASAAGRPGAEARSGRDGRRPRRRARPAAPADVLAALPPRQRGGDPGQGVVPRRRARGHRDAGRRHGRHRRGPRPRRRAGGLQRDAVGRPRSGARAAGWTLHDVQASGGDEVVKGVHGRRGRGDGAGPHDGGLRALRRSRRAPRRTTPPTGDLSGAFVWQSAGAAGAALRRSHRCGPCGFAA